MDDMGGRRGSWWGIDWLSSFRAVAVLTQITGRRFPTMPKLDSGVSAAFNRAQVNLMGCHQNEEEI